MQRNSTSPNLFGDQEVKRCKGCNNLLPLSAFHLIRNKHGKKYPYTYCKPCGLKNRSKWHHTAKGQKAHRGHMLRIKYGITHEQYNQMHKSQNGVCRICKQVETRKNRRGEIRLLAIDHDHVTGRIRALLCSSCNCGIGYFRDDVKLLRAAARYLKAFD